MSDTQVLVEWDNDSDASLAKDCMEILCKAYPGHPWHVYVAGGVIVIKHMRISAKWGQVQHYGELAHDAKKRKHAMLFAGGELLESAGLIVGVDDGRPVQAVDGIPQKDLVR
jgi:hypothetical protein